MHDSAECRRAVLRRARRALEEGAELPLELSETIRCSWTRSRLAAAPMDRIAVPYVAADMSAERLLRAARPVLDRFALQLAGTHVSLVLADPDGRIVGRWAGDTSALRKLARVSIEEGYVLAEDLAGTNGVGTALEELAPVIIFGAEHYTEPLQRLVCAGVPIRHPLTRRIEGVLDLACPTADANGLLMPATLDLGAQIEREMSMRAPERERVVFDAFVARSRTTSAALVALSEQYMVTNAAAADLLEPRDESCLWEQAVESLGTGEPVTRTMQLSGGSTITARCTPIMTGARPVGALIEVKLTERSPAASRRRGKVTVAPKQSRATVQFERELAEVVRSPASRILLQGEPGSGRMFTARRIHGLRCPGTTLAVYPAGLAQVQGGRAGELAQLLYDERHRHRHQPQLLDERTHQGLADLLDGQLGPRLVLMTCATTTQSCQATSTICDSILGVQALRQPHEDIPELIRASCAPRPDRAGRPAGNDGLDQLRLARQHAAGGARPKARGKDLPWNRHRRGAPRHRDLRERAGHRTLTRQSLERDTIGMPSGIWRQSDQGRRRPGHVAFDALSPA